MEQSHHPDQLQTPSNRSRRPISPARQSSRRPLSSVDAINSLLSHLSPSYVLEALLATSPSSHPVLSPASYSVRDPQTFINAAAAQASSSERKWGIKAARFAKKVLEWQEELAAWWWPRDKSTNGFLARYQDPQIQIYQRRVENIQDELRRLEANELKDYVREAHSRSGLGVSLGASQYEVLDDFTALITATIVQALPRLAQLNGLLGAWSTRFAILRRVSSFLQDMTACIDSMLAANLAIQVPSSPTIRSTTRFSQRIFQDTKAGLEDQVTSLAQRLDMMLDLLEGSQDTLPDTWIDDMDRLENEYGSWVVQAQQVVLNNELDAQHTRTRVDFTRDDYLGSFDDSLIPQEHSINRNLSSNNFDRTRADFVSPASGATAFQESRDVSLGMEQDALQSKVAEQSHQLDRSDKTFSSDDNSVDLESLKDISASATTESSSNVSSPLISHAEIATNLGSPVMVHSPVTGHRSMGFPPASKNTSPPFPMSEANQRRSWHGLPTLESSQPQRRRRSSTVTQKLNTSENYYTSNGNAEIASKTPSVRPRSASIQSFELIQRKEIRTIQIKRSQTAPLPNVLLSSSDLRLKDIIKKAPGRSQEINPLNGSGLLPKASDPVLREDPRKAVDILGTLAMKKTSSNEIIRDQNPSITHLDLPQTDELLKKAAILQESPSKSRAAQLQAPPTNRLDQQINSILSNIPADIRLMSAPEPGMKRMQTSSNVPKISASRRVSLPRIMRSKTAVPGVSATLAPAVQTSSSDGRAAGDSDIKLYHLHQVGKESPIKLYVRLVGETSERVMVRVGGGWADLEEYLKEYASHHGKRSISEGKFRLQGMPSTASSFSSTLHPNPPPSAATVTSSTTAATSRSVSPSPFAAGIKNPKSQRQTILPPESKSSPPRTPPSDLFGSTDGESPSPGVGLAGPRTRKIDISPRKQAWVEGMLRQARGAGAGDRRRDKGRKSDGTGGNKSSSAGGGVGDLGKVGGVKRVFFRHRQESL